MHANRRLQITLALASVLAGALSVGCGESDPGSATLYSSLAPGSASAAPLPFAWPPERGAAYPDLELLDHRGEPVELSSFAGKVLLIEPIGMT